MTAPAKGAAAPPPELMGTPPLSLHGAIDDTLLSAWLEGLAKARNGSGALVLELATTGGDADIGRRIAEDVRLFREQTGRRALFLGRAMIYSAGITIMAGFAPADRWLGQDASVLIHGRKLTTSLSLDGPLRSERGKVEALLAEIDEGLRLERDGFERLIEGSDISLAELERQIVGNWYLSASEAARRGLVAGLI